MVTQDPGETNSSAMGRGSLFFPWIGLALATVLVLKLMAVVVGSHQGEEPVALGAALAFTVHDYGPMALVGLLVAAMALQVNDRSLPDKVVTMARRLTGQLTAVLAILLAVFFLGSAVLMELELQQEFARHQADMAQEVVQLQEELEHIQSSAFLEKLAEPGRLEELRAGFPDLPPDAAAEETVAALQRILLQDLDQLQQVQESHSTAGGWEGWGTRLFSQLPDVVLAVAAIVIAGLALASTAKKKLPAKEHQPTN